MLRNEFSYLLRMVGNCNEMGPKILLLMGGRHLELMSKSCLPTYMVMDIIPHCSESTYLQI